ncbi:hypothetical protein HAX54_014743 [Datura stramonium]|uniref:Uncharacterized protein n=1 Tax=Datura stramonium TaxID=4076 RepID=A0ABS8Y681_DATST|nr:hypothetical protein [Datura stramonium]
MGLVTCFFVVVNFALHPMDFELFVLVCQRSSKKYTILTDTLSTTQFINPTTIPKHLSHVQQNFIDVIPQHQNVDPLPPVEIPSHLNQQDEQVPVLPDVGNAPTPIVQD